ncbi:hypothetical protein CAP48_13650 [Advenella sp. S44]|uniref:hypothetical protein n=1 Tax=Advenella sp. S44 TaxID=1982755 RepID=UPI000C2A4B50|nr:hypothetical protein [Advenella sp. S44]PJX23097.1 hypothetical protein CAP48_13650 [Advenella sp. S44]
MNISAAPSSSSSLSSSSNTSRAVKIIVDSNKASHIDATGNCYVNPHDCAIQCAPDSSAYIFDIEFLQQLRRHIRKAGRFELDATPLSQDLKNVATSLLNILQKNVTRR